MDGKSDSFTMTVFKGDSIFKSTCFNQRQLTWQLVQQIKNLELDKSYFS